MRKGGGGLKSKNCSRFLFAGFLSSKNGAKWILRETQSSLIWVVEPPKSGFNIFHKKKFENKFIEQKEQPYQKKIKNKKGNSEFKKTFLKAIF